MGWPKSCLLLVRYVNVFYPDNSENCTMTLKRVFDPTRTLHEESYCVVELVRQVGAVGRETRELQETVRYLESRYTHTCTLTLSRCNYLADDDC